MNEIERECVFVRNLLCDIALWRRESGVSVADHGASYRQIIDLSNLDNSMFIGSVRSSCCDTTVVDFCSLTTMITMQLGQSEQPLSAFFENWFDLWLRGNHVPMRGHSLASYSRQTLKAPKK